MNRLLNQFHANIISHNNLFPYSLFTILPFQLFYSIAILLVIKKLLTLSMISLKSQII